MSDWCTAGLGVFFPENEKKKIFGPPGRGLFRAADASTPD